MVWIALAAAAQLSAPQPKYIWLSNDDTPVQEMTEDVVRVRLGLVVHPDGRVHSCAIEQSSGDPRIDRYTCDLARRRALFSPARSAGGKATIGVYRVRVVWAQEPRKLDPAGDLIVPIPSRPKGLRLPAIIRVMFAVGLDGEISGCTGEPPSLGMDRNVPVLVPIACAELLKRFAPAAAKDDDGRPVESVQNASVVFTKD
jgi:TonB family protein